MIRFDRLEKLATFVEMGGPPGHKFDMSHWGNWALAAKAECGTAGCMGGLATLLWPDLVWLRGGTPYGLPCLWDAEMTNDQSPCKVMERFMGITWEESLDLFGNIGYFKVNDNKHHARRLRDFIERKQKELGQ